MQAATVAGLIAETIPIIATKNKSIPKVFITFCPRLYAAGSAVLNCVIISTTKIQKISIQQSNCQHFKPLKQQDFIASFTTYHCIFYNVLYTFLQYSGSPHRATPAKHDPTERHPAKARTPGSPKDEAKARNTDSQKHRQPTEKKGINFYIKLRRMCHFFAQVEKFQLTRRKKDSGTAREASKILLFFCRSVPAFIP